MIPKFWLSIIIFALAFSVSAQEDESITVEDLADADGQFAEIDGVSIYYRELGNPDDPAVIFIHGFGGSTFTWRDNLEPLAQDGYYVVALDLPPFGLSDKSPDISYTRRSYADYIAGLMDELEIETASFVGHSMGGTTLAYFVVAYPERVKTLVFVAGGLSGSGSDSVEADGDSGGSPLGFLANIDVESEQAAFILETALVPATFAGIIETAYYDPDMMTDEVAQGYARPILVDDWAAGFIAYWTVEDENPISLDELAAVATMPTLIMWGIEDTWVPIAMGYEMEVALPNARLIDYPQVGHLLMEEYPAAFNEDLLAFLNAN